MWEQYYSNVKQIPKRFRHPSSIVTEMLPTFMRGEIERVLDLGCGVGRHCIYLATKGFDVVGIDVSRSALKVAKMWGQNEKLKNISLIRATMTNLPFRDVALDAAISISVIFHALKKEIVKTVQEIYRVLKKNGVFCTDLISVKDPRYGTGLKVENNTFKILEKIEETRFEELHHFFTQNEVSKLVNRFSDVKIEHRKDKRDFWWFIIMALK